MIGASVRPFGVREAKRHVAVLLRKARGAAGQEQVLVFRRRLDRIEPVALIDRRAFGNQPAAGMALQPVEEARARGQIDRHAFELLPHADDDARFGHRAIPSSFTLGANR